jgi:hypothetical protein
MTSGFGDFGLRVPLRVDRRANGVEINVNVRSGPVDVAAIFVHFKGAPLASGKPTMRSTLSGGWVWSYGTQQALTFPQLPATLQA